MNDPLTPDPSKYFNRELSWLSFNRRVLEEAANPAHPLLERLRFLSISGSNLDEFFMTRVAGLKGQQLQGIENLSMDGCTPTQQLDAIARDADALVVAQQAEWILLKEMLGDDGIEVINASDCTPAECEWLEKHFREQILPVLTPQAIDPSHPFPIITNLGLSLIFALETEGSGEPVTELLMIPSTLKRFVKLPGDGARFVAIDNVILAHFSMLFPGFRKVAAGAFRLLRDSVTHFEQNLQILDSTGEVPVRLNHVGGLVVIVANIFGPFRLAETRGLADVVDPRSGFE